MYDTIDTTYIYNNNSTADVLQVLNVVVQL